MHRLVLNAKISENGALNSQANLHSVLHCLASFVNPVHFGILLKWNAFGVFDLCLYKLLHHCSGTSVRAYLNLALSQVYVQDYRFFRCKHGHCMQ